MPDQRNEEPSVRADVETLPGISRASFWRPEYMPLVSAWFEHAPFAFWLMDAMRPSTFVELGTHTGFSFFAACQAAQRAELSTACYAVDTWQGDDHAGLYDESVYLAVFAERERAYRGFAELLRSTFDEALARFPDGSIDLLHIDGRHGYDDVRHDFETWLPKMSKRGVVLFHDTNVRERDFGVFKLWGELEGRYPTFAFLHGHGLGVLSLAENVEELPPALAPLFRLDVNARAAVRDAYARLGEAVVRQFQLQTALSDVASLRREAAERASELERERANLARVTERTHALEHDLARSSAELERLRELSQTTSSLLTESRIQANTIAVRYTQTRRELDATERSLPGRISRSWASAAAHVPAPLGRSLAKTRALARTALPGKRGAKDPRLVDEAGVVAASSLFDAAWYIVTYPDVASSGMGAAEHYVAHGAAEGRDPSPLFSTRGYLEHNEDVAGTDSNPLVHYERHGRAEGRRAPPRRT